MSGQAEDYLPPKWLKCPPIGRVLMDLFIPCKTPLDQRYTRFIEADCIFKPECLFEAARPVCFEKFIILTYTYYKLI